MMEYMNLIFYIILSCWYLGVIWMICYLYNKNSKPYETKFHEKYYDKLPSTITSAELSYLLYHKIKPEALTSIILSLINKKALKISPQQDDYILERGQSHEQLSKLEDFTLGLIINLIGDGKQVSLNQIRDYCHDYRSNSDFLFQYQIWHKIAKNEVMKKNFYEEKTSYQWVKFYRNIGALLFIANILGGYELFIGYATILPTWFLTFYFHKIYKRKEEYQEEYQKWLAFKNYLLIKDKEKFNSEFIKPSVVLEVVKDLNQFYPEQLNVNFAYRLNEGIKKCYKNANLHGKRTMRKNEISSK